ncbi:helix-turn-helix domain-containing protein [Glaciibacter superstes]|uniref:helix-turn-helix domain-containing protein n=1 Tax=Glaciibacter superstes TaxID=501023 RepID=UPI0003B6BB65|nr:helix-turn-helix domain-containing protein [Glaciibacter superstes]
MPHIPRGQPAAVLRPKAASQAFEIERIAPRESLAEFVDYYWLVRWSTPEPFRQQVVPQPRIQLAAEHGRLLVHGVSRQPFFRSLHGDGHALGAAFHAAGFRPFLRSSVGSVSGQVVPAGDLFDIDDAPVAEAILGDRDDSGKIVGLLENYLELRRPRSDHTATDLTALVAFAEHTPELTRADELAHHAGLGLRTLQRLFTEYVGIGPKWVIQRFRLLDAAQAAHTGTDVDWAGLAAHLGFSDQAHLTRVFAHVVGTPPAAYAREARAEP